MCTKLEQISTNRPRKQRTLSNSHSFTYHYILCTTGHGRLQNIFKGGQSQRPATTRSKYVLEAIIHVAILRSEVKLRFTDGCNTSPTETCVIAHLPSFTFSHSSKCRPTQSFGRPCDRLHIWIFNSNMWQIRSVIRFVKCCILTWHTMKHPDNSHLLPA